MMVAQRKAQALNGRVRQRKAQAVKEVGPHQLAIIDSDGIHYVITTERDLDASGQTAWTSAVAREVRSARESVKREDLAPSGRMRRALLDLEPSAEHRRIETDGNPRTIGKPKPDPVGMRSIIAYVRSLKPERDIDSRCDAGVHSRSVRETVSNQIYPH
jgi:hypothetical protein